MNDEKETFVVVELNAKLRPEDQGELEDAFLDVCDQLDIPAQIIGGGGLVDTNGEVIESVIEIVLSQCNDLMIEQIIGFFEASLAPKGSRLTLYDQVSVITDESASTAEISESGGDSTEDHDLITDTDVDEGRTIHFGHQEGLALYLNGKDLPKKIYQKYPVRQVFDKCNSLLKGVGMVNSYWEGNTETALYMYGENYEQMVKRLEPLISTHPLCQKSRLIQIA